MADVGDVNGWVMETEMRIVMGFDELIGLSLQLFLKLWRGVGGEVLVVAYCCLRTGRAGFDLRRPDWMTAIYVCGLTSLPRSPVPGNKLSSRCLDERILDGPVGNRKTRRRQHCVMTECPGAQVGCEAVTYPTHTQSRYEP